MAIPPQVTASVGVSKFLTKAIIEEARKLAKIQITADKTGLSGALVEAIVKSLKDVDAGEVRRALEALSGRARDAGINPDDFLFQTAEEGSKLGKFADKETFIGSRTNSEVFDLVELLTSDDLRAKIAGTEVSTDEDRRNAVKTTELLEKGQVEAAEAFVRTNTAVVRTIEKLGEVFGPFIDNIDRLQGLGSERNREDIARIFRELFPETDFSDEEIQRLIVKASVDPGIGNSFRRPTEDASRIDERDRKTRKEDQEDLGRGLVEQLRADGDLPPITGGLPELQKVESAPEINAPSLKTDFSRKPSLNVDELFVEKATVVEQTEASQTDGNQTIDRSELTPDVLKKLDEMKLCLDRMCQGLEKTGGQVLPAGFAPPRGLTEIAGNFSSGGDSVAQAILSGPVGGNGASLPDFLRETEQLLGLVTDGAGNMGTKIFQAFETAVTGAETFQGGLLGVLDSFSAIGGKAGKVLGIISGVLGSVFGGPDGGILSIFGKAGGGTIQPRMPTIVGERGLELFIPNSGGRIANNADARSMLGRPAINITQNMTFTTDVSNSVRAEILNTAGLGPTEFASAA